MRPILLYKKNMADSDKQSKIVENDSMFGDDAGFLSWLGIEVQLPEVEDEEDDLQEVEKTPPVTEQEPTKMKEARVIKKASETEDSIEAEEDTHSQAQKKDDKSRKEVDDLISKKSQSDFTTTRRPPRGRGRRGSRRDRWSRRSSRQHPHDSRATVKIGATTRSSARGGTAPTKKQKKTYKVSDSLKKKWTITVGEAITVKEFSEKMWVPLAEVMKVLLANKIVVAAQASIDFDTATLVANEFEVTVERESTKAAVEDILEGNLQAILDQDKEAEDLKSRPPIVTIMWHVDHGKTKLLDHLRQTDVVAGEAWGITQSIGASQITHNDQKITFIDTPGHELFTSLRARWAKITNIVVIVVAADDGIKPQTIEAINHAKDSDVPIIVAVTKIDLGTHMLDEIKGQLAEHGLQPEERGGDVMVVPCSSVTGQGIDELLDAVVLQYEMLELQYSPSRDAVAVVVEAHKDKKQGVTTSLLVMTGTLQVGDILVVHNTYGRVRKMMDRKGNELKEATGGDPVVILGIQDLPEPGRVAEVVQSDKEATKKIATIQAHEDNLSKDAMLQTIMDKIDKGDKVQLKLILKADSFGSLEAIKQATQNITLPDNVELKIIHSDVGGVTDSDLVFAQAAQALVVGFNVWASASLSKKADNLGVEIKEYDIIYEYIEYVEKLAQGMIELEEHEVKIGSLEVLGVFFKRGKEMIFGGKVTDGKVVNGAKFKVWREDDEQVDEDGEPAPVATGKVTSLQKEKDNVSEVKEGHECGMKAKVSKKIEVGDRIDFYVIEKR